MGNRLIKVNDFKLGVGAKTRRLMKVNGGLKIYSQEIGNDVAITYTTYLIEYKRFIIILLSAYTLKYTQTIKVYKTIMFAQRSLIHGCTSWRARLF
jgi:hypothetical protein